MRRHPKLQVDNLPGLHFTLRYLISVSWDLRLTFNSNLNQRYLIRKLIDQHQFKLHDYSRNSRVFYRPECIYVVEPKVMLIVPFTNDKGETSYL